jgi:CheY-like chemotaxis protein
MTLMHEMQSGKEVVMQKKILVIDDDLNVRDYLVSLFEDNGYEVCVAGDVKQGLDMAKKAVPDLITLDIEMPGEWGPRFYQKLSKDPDLKDTPVVVISGLSGHKDAVVKAVASISKPFDRDKLLKIVKETLN